MKQIINPSDVRKPWNLVTPLLLCIFQHTILFNLIIDIVISSVKKICWWYRMGQISINILCYAGDAILLANNKDDWQRLLHQFQTTAESFNMQISVEKTESMVITKEILTSHKPIHQCMQYTYWGVKITSSKNLQQKVRAQVKISSENSIRVWRDPFDRMMEDRWAKCARIVNQLQGEPLADLPKNGQLIPKRMNSRKNKTKP